MPEAIAPRRVLCLGPSGTYSEQCARERFSGCECELVGSITEVISRIGSARLTDAVIGVVPLESAAGGDVAETHRALAQTGPVTILERISHPVRICVLAGAATDVAGARTVASRPIVFDECRQWLATSGADLERQGTQSTAVAARLAARQPGLLALADCGLAARFGLRCLAHAIQDDPRNVTVFAVIAPPG